MSDSAKAPCLFWLADGRLLWWEEEREFVFENGYWARAECEGLRDSVGATPLGDAEIADLVFSGIVPHQFLHSKRGHHAVQVDDFPN